jgi:hypothetical protein
MNPDCRLQALNGVEKFTDVQFKAQVASVYVWLVELMQSKHLEVRTALHRLFLRIGTTFDISND